MCGVGKGPPKNHKKNFKKCQDFFFFLPTVQLMQTDRALLVWFEVFCLHLQILLSKVHHIYLFFTVFKKSCQALEERKDTFSREV